MKTQCRILLLPLFLAVVTVTLPAQSAFALGGTQVTGKNVQGSSQTHGSMVNGATVNGTAVVGENVGGEAVDGFRVSGDDLSGIAVDGVETSGEQVNGVDVDGVDVSGEQISGIELDGIEVSGEQTNGVAIDGVDVSGEQISGIEIDGIEVSGEQTNGVAVDGVEVSGEQISGIAVDGIEVSGEQTNGVAVDGVEISGEQINGIAVDGIEVSGEQTNGVAVDGIAVDGVSVTSIDSGKGGTTDKVTQDTSGENSDNGTNESSGTESGNTSNTTASTDGSSNGTETGTGNSTDSSSSVPEAVIKVDSGRTYEASNSLSHMSSDDTEVVTYEESASKGHSADITLGIEGNYVEGEGSLYEYGSDTNNIKIGHYEGSAGYGIEYNPSDNSFKANVVDIGGEFVTIEGNIGTQNDPGDLLAADAHVEALSTGANASLGIEYEDDKFSAGASLKAEATLAEASATGEIHITPKSVYDNTLGAIFDMAGWEDVSALPDSWDHGIVIGATGTIGIGASAAAEAQIVSDDDFTGVQVGTKVGLGPQAGVNLQIGVK